MYYHFNNHIQKAKYTSIDQIAIINHNMGLVNRFPFLIPRNAFSGKVVEDYDFTWTELDELPEAWKEAFGEQIAEEINDVLIKAGYSDKYRITQIKEKYGQLRWYDEGVPKEIWDEVQKVIRKYEVISEKICICCGKPATHLTSGWITHVCKDCYDKIEKKNLEFV